MHPRLKIARAAGLASLALVAVGICWFAVVSPLLKQGHTARVWLEFHSRFMLSRVDYVTVRRHSGLLSAPVDQLSNVDPSKLLAVERVLQVGWISVHYRKYSSQSARALLESLEKATKGFRRTNRSSQPPPASPSHDASGEVRSEWIGSQGTAVWGEAIVKF